MTVPIALVFGVLLATMVLFVTEWLRMDLTALLALLALMLLKILTPEEALAGFSDPVVLMIAGLFVVSGSLQQTGMAHALSRMLTKIGGAGEVRLLLVTMGTVALLSALMSSSGATAILIPVVVNLAWQAKISPSKLLLPLALGSLIGGLLTLIGTPPNLVISNQLVSRGLPPLNFFTLTPIGVCVLLLGIGFMALVGRHWLPDRAQDAPGYTGEEADLSLEDLAAAYHLPSDLFRVRVRATSPLVASTLSAANLRQRYHVSILEIQPWPAREGLPGPARMATPETVIQANDLLRIQGATEAVTRLARIERLGILPPEETAGPVLSQEVGLVELLLPPRSHLIGQTLQEFQFRDRYQVTVLSVRRYGEPLAGDTATLPLRFGDTLLVLGTWERIRALQREHRNFIVVGQPREMLEAQRTPRRALTAGLIIAVMLVLMSFSITPPVVAVLLAAAAIVLFTGMSMEQAYDTLNWQSIVLMAGMLPMATALQNTGGMAFIANALTQSLGQFGPLVTLAGLFVLTALFSQFISNTATTVLMAPIAYYVAVSLAVSPYPLLVAVAVAASTAFATPVSTLSGALVMAPGGYRFGDYVKVGGTFQVLVLLGCLVVIPLLFPF